MSLTQSLPGPADMVNTEPIVSTYIICVCRHSFCSATWQRWWCDEDDGDEEAGVWFGSDWGEVVCDAVQSDLIIIS